MLITTRKRRKRRQKLITAGVGTLLFLIGVGVGWVVSPDGGSSGSRTILERRRELRREVGGIKGNLEILLIEYAEEEGTESRAALTHYERALERFRGVRDELTVLNATAAARADSGFEDVKELMGRGASLEDLKRAVEDLISALESTVDQ